MLVLRRAGLYALLEDEVGRRRLAEVEASGERFRPVGALTCPVSIVAGKDTQRANVGNRGSRRVSARASIVGSLDTTRDSIPTKTNRRSRRSRMRLDERPLCLR